MLRKERILKDFYSDFDSVVLGERKTRREQSQRECGEESSSGLKDLKEEPVENMTLDLENRRYNFFLRPAWGGD